mgnify:CR=1 FL=1
MTTDNTTDWADWEAVADAYGRERHRPTTDHNGQPFMPEPEEGAALLSAEQLPPGVRLIPYGNYYSPNRVRFIPRRAGEVMVGPWGAI